MMQDQTKYMQRLGNMKEGAVTFLDVLGWKGIWERTDKAGDVLLALIDELNKKSDEFINSKIPTHVSYRGLKTEIKSISDTIAMFSSGNSEAVLEVHGEICKLAICRSIEEGIPLRGATCYGHFTTKENIMIGPAVDEAASWHEVADWIGVILSPSALFKCSAYDNNSIWKMNYDVPAKGYGKYKTHCVNWYSEWKKGKKEMEEQIKKELLLDAFLKMGPLTPNISAKFTNTLAFYDACCKESNTSLDFPVV